MKNKLTYAIIETQHSGDYEGRNLIGIYSSMERAEKEVIALEDEYQEEYGHTYEIEVNKIDGNTWLNNEDEIELHSRCEFESLKREGNWEEDYTYEQYVSDHKSN